MLVGLSGNGVELVALSRKKGRYASHTIAVGASGAIFALGGTLVALVPKVKVIVVPVSPPFSAVPQSSVTPSPSSRYQ